MELRLGYKHTEAGVIPDDWDALPLGRFVQITSGDSPSLIRFTSIGKPYFKVEQLSNSDKYLGVFSTPYHFVDGKTVPRRSVIFAKRGGAIALNKIRILSEESFMDTNLMALTPKDGLDFEYLYYGIGYIGLWRFADTTSVPQINNKHINPLPFPLPKETEHREIASALNDVDLLLATLDQMIDKKRDLKQAAMQALLTGKRRLPGFSGEWKLKSFGDLFDFSGGYSASRDQLSEEGHCYLHYGDIHGSSKTSVNTKRDFLDIPKLDISLKRVSESSLLKHGDVVFVDASEDDAGTSKHLVIENEGDVPFISGLHTIVAKSKTNDLADTYKHYCFQTMAIRQQFMFYAVGTKVSGISKTNIAKLTLPIPSIPEQVAIATALSNMDVELAALEARRDKTRNIKQAMMQVLLTGKTRLMPKEESHV
jgi:type I restriction enzyme S subunit